MIAYQSFKYPSCDSIVTLIGSGELYASCKESNTTYKLNTTKSVCMYYAFKKDTATAHSIVQGTLKGKYYDHEGQKVGNTDAITTPFVVVVDNPNTFCNSDLAGANVTGAEGILSLTLTQDGATNFTYIGKAKGINMTMIIIIVGTIISIALIVILVVVGICIYHCVSNKPVTFPDQPQLELGMIEVPPKEYNPYEGKNPLAAAQDKVV